MRTAGIVGITVVITLIVVFGAQFALVSMDTSQRASQTTESGKAVQMQEQTPQPVKSTSSQATIPVKSTPSTNCSGNARCFTGQVTGVVDGDTISVDGQSIRFALASTPEINTPMGLAAKQFVLQTCPLGSKVKVDEDDGQTQGSYGRMIAVIYCNGVNLNQAVIEKGFGHLSFAYCDNSEFSDNAWSGCGSPQQTTSSKSQYSSTSSNCDPNYSGQCVPISSRDLDCSDVGKNIKVTGSDPHGFDRDGDGIGCEG